MEKELTPQQKAAIEYSRRIRAKEFEMPEALRDKTNFDVLTTPEFEAILTNCINEQVETRTKVLETIAELKKKGKKVAEKRPTIDRVIELGLMDIGRFALEFAMILAKKSNQPREIRDYIRQLGMRAYRATINKFICDANPEMAELMKQISTQN